LEASHHWHIALGAPILAAPGLRGSALILLTSEYIRRAEHVVRWSVADTGGVRAGFSPLPSDLADALYLPADRLQRLLDLAEADDALAQLVRDHQPLPRHVLNQVLDEKIASRVSQSPYDVYSWIYEVIINRPPPVDISAVAELIIPNVLLKSVLAKLPVPLRSKVRTFNPAIGVESAMPASGSEATSALVDRTPLPFASPIMCIGVYESVHARHFPYHAPPILARANGEGRWRRERYRIKVPYEIDLVGGNGPFLPIENLSVRRGDYVSSQPVELLAHSQVIVVAQHDVIAVSDAVSVIKALWRGLTRAQGRRCSYLVGAWLTFCNWWTVRGSGNIRPLGSRLEQKRGARIGVGA
jgi:hypothetical protein